jgi:hypothetical protein
MQLQLTLVWRLLMQRQPTPVWQHLLMALLLIRWQLLLTPPPTQWQHQLMQLLLLQKVRQHQLNKPVLPVERREKIKSAVAQKAAALFLRSCLFQSGHFVQQFPRRVIDGHDRKT